MKRNVIVLLLAMFALSMFASPILAQSETDEEPCYAYVKENSRGVFDVNEYAGPAFRTSEGTRYGFPVGLYTEGGKHCKEIIVYAVPDTHLWGVIWDQIDDMEWLQEDISTDNVMTVKFTFIAPIDDFGFTVEYGGHQDGIFGFYKKSEIEAAKAIIEAEKTPPPHIGGLQKPAENFDCAYTTSGTEVAKVLIDGVESPFEVISDMLPIVSVSLPDDNESHLVEFVDPKGDYLYRIQTYAGSCEFEFAD